MAITAMRIGTVSWYQFRNGGDHNRQTILPVLNAMAAVLNAMRDTLHCSFRNLLLLVDEAGTCVNGEKTTLPTANPRTMADISSILNDMVINMIKYPNNA